MRIGLISDTHIPVAAPELWPQVYDAFRGVDLIMHAGDLMVPEVIDWLEEVAPVVAVWGNGDWGGWQRTAPPNDARLSEAKVLTVALTPDPSPADAPHSPHHHGRGENASRPARPEALVGRAQHDASSPTLVRPHSQLTTHNSQLRIGLVHDLQLPEHPPLRTLEGQMSHYFGGAVDVIVRGSTHAAEITTVKGVLIVNPGSPTFPNHQSTRLGTIGFLDIDDGRVEASIVQLM